MKITPVELVQSWNALNEIIAPNDGQPEFTAQAERLQMQIRNEIIFWNNLSLAKRNAIMDEPMTITIDAITATPAYYANDELDALNRFFATDLEPKPAAMSALLQEDNPQPQNEEE